MNAKEKAELVISDLRAKGYTDEEIAEAVMGFLKELNT